MLSRLDIGADSFLRHLVIQDNFAGIAIQRHALPNTVFDGDDNLSATGETDRTLGCTTVRVELAYGMLFVLFKYGDMFTLGLVKDENPVI